MANAARRPPWARAGGAPPVRVGHRTSFDGRNVSAQVLETGRPTRIDHYGPDAGAGPAPFVAAGIQSVAGAPINVEGRLWGVMMVLSSQERLPTGTEARLAEFTELVATAVANAEARRELTASRARIVTAADNTRRRIERICTTGPSNTSSRWRCSCAPCRQPCRRTPPRSPRGWVS